MAGANHTEYADVDDTELAITVGAHALIKPKLDASDHQQITVRKGVSATTIEKYIQKTLGQEDLPDEKRPGISLTEQEKTPPDTAKGQISMLLVGLCADSVQLPEYKVNAKAATPPNLYYLPKDTKVLRVATLIKENVVNADLFALVDQRDGLCEAYKISSKNCFYFPAFRTKTKNRQVRATEWQSIVRAAVINIASVGKPSPEAELDVLLCDFFDKNAEMDMDEVYKRLPGCWADTGVDYGVEVLDSVRKAVRFCCVVVEARLRRGFLLLVCHRIKRTPDDWEYNKEATLLECERMAGAMCDLKARG
ncbi:hypothetical protein M409DRAFT_28098 [Zasmidium cellare ATCC 36951]|uniref:Uncharacterized protein n=1 Tax=Zasmidium cellare ATCC 36951 TaxID=1080233 RepID=A0A6A6C355_ZASCE|nr:uncharacterized protein M409DRAFT_28098 [Zasmidium cellare ATCC 36951]KAF2161363.1 hypothetical protein M409DRAFT_28098 [Zasmidium cellare ATCC 36951]